MRSNTPVQTGKGIFTEGPTRHRVYLSRAHGGGGGGGDRAAVPQNRHKIARTTSKGFEQAHDNMYFGIQ